MWLILLQERNKWLICFASLVSQDKMMDSGEEEDEKSFKSCATKMVSFFLPFGVLKYQTINACNLFCLQ